MNFNEKKDIRLSDSMLKNIKKAVASDRLKYVNESHFVRVAIIKQLKNDGVIL